MEFKKNINKIKCVLFDFDDTLAIHQDHKEYTKEEDEYFNAKIIKGEYNWPRSVISEHMKLFLDYCDSNNMKMFLISASPAMIANEKLKWVENNYGYKLSNLCVNTHEDKVNIAKSVSIAYGINLDEILIVDDYFKVLSDAENIGIEVATPMEIVNFIEQNKSA